MELVDDSPWSVQSEWDGRTEDDYHWIETRSGNTVIRDIGKDKEIAILVSLIPEMLSACRIQEVISYIEDLIAVYEEGAAKIQGSPPIDKESRPVYKELKRGDQRREALSSASGNFLFARKDALDAINEHDSAVNIVGEDFIKALGTWTFETFRKGDVKQALSGLEMRAGIDRNEVLDRLGEASEGRKDR